MAYALGIAAALGAPFVMTLGFIVFDNHWKGSAFGLNLFKCNLATIGFIIVSFSTRLSKDDELFPREIFTTEKVGFLMLSSVLGILIGDWLWLEALRLLGAGPVILMDTCKPFLAALFGWAMLGEKLRPPAFGGMALTVLGVLLVSMEQERQRRIGEEKTKDEHSSLSIEEGESTRVEELDSGDITPLSNLSADDSSLSATEEKPPITALDLAAGDPVLPSEESEHDTYRKKRDNDKRTRTPQQWRTGLIFAAANVLFDTFGSIWTKKYGVGMTAWEINLIRFGFAGISMLALSCILHARDYYFPKQEQQDRDEGESTSSKSSNGKWYGLPEMSRRSWMHISFGVLFLTFLTPALSNYALFQIALALALTLGSVGPLYALPLTWLMQSQKPTVTSSLGALAAVGGIIILAFFGTLD
jgi:drug/metabolite transporter (DMT)-like permease